MKRKRNFVQVSELPDECWECIFRFLNDDDFTSLSLVSKQFLSITNRLRLSLTIRYPNPPFLRFFLQLLQRFTNLTSIDFSRLSCDLNSLFPQISCFPLNITSLNLSYPCSRRRRLHLPNFPANGLRPFSQNNKTLTSLTCSHVSFDYYHHLFLIADCFPLLQILDLSNTDIRNTGRSHSGLKDFEFPKLEVLNLSRTRVDDQQLFIISKACPGLLQLSLNICQQVTEEGVTHVLQNCTQLREINLALCRKVYPNIVPSMLFSRPSLRKITAPPGCILSDDEKTIFKLQGCLVC